MSSFLLELQLLKEEQMTWQLARATVIRNGGPDAKSTSVDALKAFRREILKTIHPDKGGNEETAKDVNAAIDYLVAHDHERLISNEPPKNDRTGPEWKGYYDTSSQGSSVPKWAWAGHSGGAAPTFQIFSNDYSDVNFIKKTMYFLSRGHDQDEFTLFAFDGHFFRSTLTVYGSKEILKEMAEAMFKWNSRSHATRAIFYYTKSNPRDLYLIFADGKVYEHPILCEHESFNLNPSNDQSFVRKLPDMLDKLKETGSVHFSFEA